MSPFFHMAPQRVFVSFPLTSAKGGAATFLFPIVYCLSWYARAIIPYADP